MHWLLVGVFTEQKRKTLVLFWRVQSEKRLVRGTIVKERKGGRNELPESI